MKIGFSNIDPHQNTDKELRGKVVGLALYADDMDSPAKILVGEVFAKTLVYGHLDSIFENMRTAIIDSMVRHGNPTVPRRQ